MQKEHLIIFALVCGIAVGSIKSFSDDHTIEALREQLAITTKAREDINRKYESLNQDVIKETCLLRSQL